MFNKIWDQLSVSEGKTEEEKIPFSTEKELILYMIDKSYDRSEIYDKYAPKEWKRNSKYFDTEYSMGISFRSWDSAKLKYLADHCDDADILRAVFKSDKIKREYRCITPFITNVNLPDDIIIGLCEKYCSCEYTLKWMQETKSVSYTHLTLPTILRV